MLRIPFVSSADPLTDDQLQLSDSAADSASASASQHRLKPFTAVFPSHSKPLSSLSSLSRLSNYSKRVELPEPMNHQQTDKPMQAADNVPPFSLALSCSPSDSVDVISLVYQPTQTQPQHQTLPSEIDCQAAADEELAPPLELDPMATIEYRSNHVNMNLNQNPPTHVFSHSTASMDAATQPLAGADSTPTSSISANFASYSSPPKNFPRLANPLTPPAASHSSTKIMQSNNRNISLAELKTAAATEFHSLPSSIATLPTSFADESKSQPNLSQNEFQTQTQVLTQHDSQSPAIVRQQPIAEAAANEIVASDSVIIEFRPSNPPVVASAVGHSVIELDQSPEEIDFSVSPPIEENNQFSQASRALPVSSLTQSASLFSHHWIGAPSTTSDGVSHYRGFISNWLDDCRCVIQVGDSVLLRCAADEIGAPWIARIEDLFENSNGEARFSARFYFRPIEIPGGLKPEFGPNEVFLTQINCDNLLETITKRIRVQHFPSAAERNQVTRLSTKSVSQRDSSLLSCSLESSVLTAGFDGVNYFCRYEFIPKTEQFALLNQPNGSFSIHNRESMKHFIQFPLNIKQTEAINTISNEIPDAAESNNNDSGIVPSSLNVSADPLPLVEEVSDSAVMKFQPPVSIFTEKTYQNVNQSNLRNSASLNSSASASVDSNSDSDSDEPILKKRIRLEKFKTANNQNQISKEISLPPSAEQFMQSRPDYSPIQANDGSEMRKSGRKRKPNKFLINSPAATNEEPEAAKEAATMARAGAESGTAAAIITGDCWEDKNRAEFGQPIPQNRNRELFPPNEPPKFKRKLIAIPKDSSRKKKNKINNAQQNANQSCNQQKPIQSPVYDKRLSLSAVAADSAVSGAELDASPAEIWSRGKLIGIRLAGGKIQNIGKTKEKINKNNNSDNAGDGGRISSGGGKGETESKMEFPNKKTGSEKNISTPLVSDSSNRVEVWSRGRLIGWELNGVRIHMESTKPIKSNSEAEPEPEAETLEKLNRKSNQQLSSPVNQSIIAVTSAKKAKNNPLANANNNILARTPNNSSKISSIPSNTKLTPFNGNQPQPQPQQIHLSNDVESSKIIESTINQSRVCVDDWHAPMNSVAAPRSPARCDSFILTPQTPGSSTVAARLLLFRDSFFLVTGLAGRSTDDLLSQADQHLNSLIRHYGGQRIENFSEFKNSNSSKQLIVITNRPLRTAKFMFSLARGLPPIHSDWLDECVRKCSIVPAYKFSLPCGVGDDGNLIHFPNPRSLKSREGLWPIPVNQRILHGLVVLVQGCDSFIADWSAVVSESGGSIYNSDSTAACLPLECHLLLIENEFQLSALLFDRVRMYRPHAVYVGWLIDSLIQQQRCNYEYYKYRHWTAQ